MPQKEKQRNYWLFKSDPESFGFAELWSAPKRRTSWDGVRNHQARNFMRDSIAIGDGILFYHSSAEPTGVAGIARVVRKAYPDATQFDPRDDHFDPQSQRDSPTWLSVEIQAVAPLKRFITLEDLKTAPELSKMLVVQRGQRLSIQPVTASEWRKVLALGGAVEQDF